MAKETKASPTSSKEKLAKAKEPNSPAKSGKKDENSNNKVVADKEKDKKVTKKEEVKKEEVKVKEVKKEEVSETNGDKNNAAAASDANEVKEEEDLFKKPELPIRLTYFDGTGRAELIRLVLAYGKLDYEDRRIGGEQWSRMKPSTSWLFLWENAFMIFYCYCFLAADRKRGWREIGL